MNNFNVPVLISSVGAILFLITPLGLFSSFSINDIYITALLIQSIGIATALFVLYRNKITQKCLEEI